MVWKDKLGPNATNEEKIVFEALDDPEWSWRTLNGIASATDLEPQTVKSILMGHQDLIRTAISQKFGPIYQLIERNDPPEEKFIDQVWDYLSMGRRRIA
jgi:hypothetical protein